MRYHIKRADNSSASVFGNFGNLQAAKDRADELHLATGSHFNVIAIETVWSTQTLDDVMLDAELQKLRNAVSK